MRKIENVIVDPRLLIALEFFVKGCQEIIQAHWEQQKFNFPPDQLHIEFGNKYAKIINEHNRGQKSVYCFVDLKTGDILKAATWRAPAKHPRGNLFDKSAGLGQMTVYGAAYLR